MLQRLVDAATGLRAGSWAKAPPGSSWGGDVYSLIPGSSSIIPAVPSLPGLFSTIWHVLQAGGVAVFGSGSADPALNASVPVTGSVETVQLSDAGGRKLFRADGSLNSDPHSRVAAVPFALAQSGADHGTTLIVRPGTAYFHQVRGKVAGSYGAIVAGRLFGVSFTCATAPEQRDDITLDIGARAFSFQTGAAQAPLRAEVMSCGPDGAPRFATLLVRSGAGMTHTLRFSSDTSAVIYEHRGDSATFELHLSAVNRNGQQHLFSSGPQSAIHGQTASFVPVDWHDLTTVLLTQSGAATTRTLSAPPTLSRG
jgi:hypothetical protein